MISTNYYSSPKDVLYMVTLSHHKKVHSQEVTKQQLTDVVKYLRLLGDVIKWVFHLGARKQLHAHVMFRAPPRFRYKEHTRFMEIMINWREIPYHEIFDVYVTHEPTGPVGQQQILDENYYQFNYNTNW